MNSESNGQHIIFIIILILILSLSYSATPMHDSGKTMHKVSKKAQTKGGADETGKIASNEEQKTSETDHAAAPAKTGESKAGETGQETQKSEVTTSSGGKGLMDIIPMNNPGYAKHSKGIVQFTHKKHVETYSIACGTCHHDDAGKPLELAEGDPVQGCMACHAETEKSKGEKLDKKEKIAKYHFEALHANCVDCHKDYNQEKGGEKAKGPAPTSCTACHPKE